MKNLICLLFVLPTVASAQVDTIFTRSEKIACVVKEITPDAVKYSFPEEELVQSVNKRVVNKIVFKSGRVQKFEDVESIFKEISSPEGYEDVYIAKNDEEVKGLHKLGEVSAKASGNTYYSKEENVRKRAYKKLKIETALMGGNVLYVFDKNSKSANYYTSSGAASYLSAEIYTTASLKLDEFKSLIESASVFKPAVHTLSSDEVTLTKKPTRGTTFTIKKVYANAGNIFIEGNYTETKVTTFQVVSYKEGMFNVFFDEKGKPNNVMVVFQ